MTRELAESRGRAKVLKGRWLPGIGLRHGCLEESRVETVWLGSSKGEAAWMYLGFLEPIGGAAVPGVPGTRG